MLIAVVGFSVPLAMLNRTGLAGLIPALIMGLGIAGVSLLFEKQHLLPLLKVNLLGVIGGAIGFGIYWWLVPRPTPDIIVAMFMGSFVGILVGLFAFNPNRTVRS